MARHNGFAGDSMMVVGDVAEVRTVAVVALSAAVVAVAEGLLFKFPAIRESECP